MDDDADKLQDMGFIQDIVSYTFDEKKIVTYKWISKELNIHVNKAKQLLYTFIKHLPEERLLQLCVTYLVGGILPDNKGCRIQVVSEEDLPKIKKQFKLITSEHIYSVSLKQCLSDIHDLFSVDGKNNESTRHGALRCEQSVKRDVGELAAKRKNAQVTIDDGKQWPAEKPKQNGTTSDKKKSSSNISSMFAAASKKKSESTAEPKKEEEPKQESAPAAVKKGPASKGAPKNAKAAGGGRLAAMFSAQSLKPKPVKKETQEDKTEKPVVKEDTKEKNSLQKETNSKSEVIERKYKSEKKEVADRQSKNEDKPSKNSKSKQKKRKVSDKDDEKNKKRKRIVLIDSDSSEDDVLGSDDEEDIDVGRCPSPSVIDDDEEEEEKKESKEEEEERENAKEPKTEPEQTRKRCRARHRKEVTKTYLDEDGYIVSKKVVEFVSCSEDEEEEKENESKKEQKTQKVSPQKISPPEKKIQATLMSFFKRN